MSATTTKLISERDRKIILLIAEGHSYASISMMLDIKEDTVKKYVHQMMQQRSFTSPYQLITWAYQNAIIT